MFRLSLVLSIIMLLSIVAGCDNPKEKSAPQKDSLLKSYINEPKAKARAVDEAAKERTEKMRKELDQY